MKVKGKKSKMIKALIGVGIVVALFLIFFIFTMVKSQAEYKKMTPSDTQEIIPGIYSIKNDYVNFYCIKNGDKYIAVDAGLDNELSQSEFKKMGINPEDVSTVLLTHTDYDHVAALKLFKNAKVYLSDQEEQMINGKTHRQLIFGNKIDSTYQLLHDGQVLNVSDLDIKCILTPGHTPGSMSYLIGGKYFFSGDAFSLKDGKAQLFNESFNMDSNTQKESIEKLKGLSGVEYIFTGHYGYTDNYKLAFGSK